ncbi:MAG: hypothetical protein WB817_15030, partial [Terriglobales bacterium]
YGDAAEAGRKIREVTAIQKKLHDLQQNKALIETGNAELRASLAEALSVLNKIIAGRADGSGHDLGLQGAARNLGSALRVVESGDREIPAGAMALYEESREQSAARTAEWTAFRQGKLSALNEGLRQAGLPVITITVPAK